MSIRDLVPRAGREREKSLARRGGYDPFLSLQRQINNVFDSFFGEAFPARGSEESEAWPALAGFSPKVDVSETEREVKVSVELPGMDEKDITVEMDESGMTISGERKEEKEEKGGNWRARERSHGYFRRIVPLPAGVEAGKAIAKFKRGVLTLKVPKLPDEQSHRKRVKIESE